MKRTTRDEMQICVSLFTFRQNEVAQNISSFAIIPHALAIVP